MLLGCNGDRGKNLSRMATGNKVVPLKSRFTKEQVYAFVLPQLAPVEGVGGVRASQCGGCHKAIYKEWRASSHASRMRHFARA